MGPVYLMPVRDNSPGLLTDNRMYVGCVGRPLQPNSRVPGGGGPPGRPLHSTEMAMSPICHATGMDISWPGFQG